MLIHFLVELVNDLLPGSFVLTLEHVLKFQKGVSPVKMDLCGSLVEVGNGLINCKLNAEFTAILVDFSFHLVV